MRNPLYVDNRATQGLVRTSRTNCLAPRSLTYQSFSWQPVTKVVETDSIVPRCRESIAFRNSLLGITLTPGTITHPGARVREA